MAKKVSKNQRTNRGKQSVPNNTAKIVYAFKTQKGTYAFKDYLVKLDKVEEELERAKQS